MGRNVKVILQPVKFRKRDHVAVLSPNSSEVDAVIREFEGAEWSTGYRFWHLQLKSTTIKEITRSLKGIAKVDSSAFKDFKYEISEEEVHHQPRIKLEKPTAEQLEKLEKFKLYLIKKGYSSGTVKVYTSMLSVFFGWFKSKIDFEISNSDINLFLEEYIEKNHLTENYRRLMTNSLRRFFDFTGKENQFNL